MVHITSLAIYGLGGGHTRIHLHRSDFKKLGRFKNVLQPLCHQQFFHFKNVQNHLFSTASYVAMPYAIHPSMHKFVHPSNLAYVVYNFLQLLTTYMPLRKTFGHDSHNKRGFLPYHQSYIQVSYITGTPHRTVSS